VATEGLNCQYRTTILSYYLVLEVISNVCSEYSYFWSNSCILINSFDRTIVKTHEFQYIYAARRHDKFAISTLASIRVNKYRQFESDSPTINHPYVTSRYRKRQSAATILLLRGYDVSVTPDLLSATACRITLMHELSLMSPLCYKKESSHPRQIK